ncbi:MAG: MbtH family protein, partial [Thioalkalivibrio sp.]|nr:MbtH family protein [Thioalkalivibrio sp.]
MPAHESSQKETCRVVVNDEQQYSIWAVHRELPAGWTDAGKSGN